MRTFRTHGPDAQEWECQACYAVGGHNPDCDTCNTEAMAEAAHPDNDPRIP